MPLRQVVFLSGQTPGRDVGTPQVGNLVRRLCLSAILWDMVGTGRRTAALMSYRGRLHAGAPEAPQERWSRGCRRADVSFWFSLWLLPWLLAPRKKKSLLIRSPSNRSRPASTSDLPARARQSRLTGPAPYSPRRAPLGCDLAPISPNLSAILCKPLWDCAALWPIRPVTSADRGPRQC